MDKRERYLFPFSFTSLLSPLFLSSTPICNRKLSPPTLPLSLPPFLSPSFPPYPQPVRWKKARCALPPFLPHPAPLSETTCSAGRATQRCLQDGHPHPLPPSLPPSLPHPPPSLLLLPVGNAGQEGKEGGREGGRSGGPRSCWAATWGRRGRARVLAPRPGGRVDPLW